VIMDIAGPNGAGAAVLTGWVISDPDDPSATPRLTTAYIKL